MRYSAMRSFRRGALGFAAVSIATLAVLGCGEKEESEPPVAQPIKIFRIGGGGPGGMIEFPGEVTPTQNAEPAFEVAGKMIEFPVDEGQKLAEGDVIARLDPRDYQSGVDRAQANADKTATDRKRYQILYDKGVSPLTDLESAKRRHEVATADLETAEKALEESVLRAPFAGTVARKLVEDFQNVQAKQPIVILQDTSSLQVVVNVPESDFAAMKPGLTIEERNRRSRSEVSISSIPDRAFPARMKEFTTSADPVSRTFQATFTFQSPSDLAVRPGMTAKVSIHPRSESQAGGDISIPTTAVRTDETGESFVWVVNPDSMTVARTAVTTGNLTGDRIAIQSGLERGSEVAVSGVFHLADGMEVRRFGQ